MRIFADVTMELQLKPDCCHGMFLQGRWEPFLKSGTMLHQALAAYFARDLVQDAVCAYCSLRATLQQASVRPAAQRPSESTTSPTAISAAEGDAKEGSAEEDRDSRGALSVSGRGEQGGAEEGAANEDGDLRGALCVGEGEQQGSEGAQAANAEEGAAEEDRNSQVASISGGGEQGSEGAQAAAEKLARLQGLLLGGCAAPECDYAQLASEGGFTWEERRGPLLTRTTIARAPQVRC